MKLFGRQFGSLVANIVSNSYSFIGEAVSADILRGYVNLHLQAAGEGIADIRAAASGVASAARGAADRGDAPAAAAPPPAPPAPEAPDIAPAEPPPPPPPAEAPESAEPDDTPRAS